MFTLVLSTEVMDGHFCPWDRSDEGPNWIHPPEHSTMLLTCRSREMIK